LILQIARRHLLPRHTILLGLLPALQRPWLRCRKSNFYVCHILSDVTLFLAAKIRRITHPERTKTKKHHIYSVYNTKCQLISSLINHAFVGKKCFIRTNLCELYKFVRIKFCRVGKYYYIYLYLTIKRKRRIIY
jgi:hypothetical protein